MPVVTLWLLKASKRAATFAAPLRCVLLLASLVDALDVPVLAAGGIGDQRAFATMLDLGAAGVRVGTRFVATEESGAHPAYKQAVLRASEGSTVITDAFADCPLSATSPALACCDRASRRMQPSE